jgi:nitroreductase
MDFSELVLKRESCRSFSGKQVEKQALEKILEAGRLAPSACNSQPWHFYAAYTPEVCAKLRDGIQVMGSNKFTDKATAFIVITGEKPNYLERVGQTLSGRDFSSIDIGITVAHMALAATASGLSSCILGMFSEGKIKDALAISKKDKAPVRLVLAIGYAENEQPKQKRRKSLEEVVSFVEQSI